MKVQEFIDKVNAIENKHIGLWELECIITNDFPEFVCDTNEQALNIMESPLQVKTTIYRCEDGFVGVSGVSELERNQTLQDITCEIQAAQYYKHTSVYYSLVP